MSKLPTICLDPGHGGHDPGAVGPNRLREAYVALDVCLRMKSILQGRCNVVMTRGDDRFITLSGRASFANANGVDLFLSVHCNAGPPGQGAGFEVWTSPGQMASDVFATRLYDAYADRFPMKPRRMDMSDGDVDKESKFTVLVMTKMPAVLFELEFIHTLTGEAWLADEKNRQACAEALAEGVLIYLGLQADGDDLGADEPQAPQPDVNDDPLGKQLLEHFAQALSHLDKAYAKLEELLKR